MWKLYAEVDDGEEEGPPLKTQAELTLQSLLERQLSTAPRMERVEFEERTENMRCIGHSSSGVGTLQQFQQHELTHTAEDDLPPSSSTQGKRKRYGSHPSFLNSAKEEVTLQMKDSTFIPSTKIRRHTEELEASLMRGKDRLKAISHLSAGDSSCRKPLLDGMEEISAEGSVAQEGVTGRTEDSCTRTASEVFTCPAPDVLCLHEYLEIRNREGKSCQVETNVISQSEIKGKDELNGSECSVVEEGTISEKEILSNKLSEKEIRTTQGGKFANYTPGDPTCVLFIKNLSSSVQESDLVALYLRFDSPSRKLIFRLMQHGRMKGQAFVTFPDADAAKRALNLTNGFILKGKPIIVQFGHGAKESCR